VSITFCDENKNVIILNTIINILSDHVYDKNQIIRQQTSMWSVNLQTSQLEDWMTEIGRVNLWKFSPKIKGKSWLENYSKCDL